MVAVRAFSTAGICALALIASGCNDSAQQQDPPSRDRTRGSNSGPGSATTPDSPSSSTASNTGTTAPLASGDPLTVAADVEVYAALQIQRQQVEMGLLSVTTYFCSSPDPLNTDTGNGSMSIAIDDVDPPGQSTGDSFTISYAACVQFGGTYNGSSKFKIDEISGTPYAPSPQVWRVSTSHSSDVRIDHATGSTTLGSSFVFSSGTADGVSYDRLIQGSFDLSNGAATPFATKFKNDYGWNVATNSFAHSVNSSYSSDFGSYALETLVPIRGVLGTAPTEGKARVTQDFGSVNMITTLTVIADGMVRVELDANGDGVVDVTYEQPWSNSALAGMVF